MLSEDENIEYDVIEDGVYEDVQQNSSESEADESDPLATSESDTADKLIREEIFGAAIDDLLAERRQSRRRSGKRRKSAIQGIRKRAKSSDVPHHLTSVMGAATLAYVTKNFDEATTLLRRLIDEAPNAVAPYRTLALICEEQGNMRDALELYMKAAEMNRQDKELWKRNAVLWEEQGEYEKAIYCVTQALRGSNSKDVEALRGRGFLYKKLGKNLKAAENFGRVAKVVPEDIGIAHIISDLHRRAGSPRKASVVVESMIHDCEIAAKRKVSTRHSKLEAILGLLEILIELRFVERRYLDAAALLSRLKDVNSEIGYAMTFVQRLMEAICHHRLVSTTVAEPTFREFMSSPIMMKKHSVLLRQVADACREGSNFSDGVRAYNLLLELETGVDSPVELHLHRAVCCINTGDLVKAKSDLEWVLSVHPRHVEALLRYQQFQSPKEVARAKRKSAKRYSNIVAYHSVTVQERKEATDALAYGKYLFDKGDFKSFLSEVLTPLETALLICEPGAGTSTNRVTDENCESTANNEKEENEITAEVGEDGEKNTESHDLPAPSSNLSRDRLHGLGASMMRVLIDDQFVETAEKVVFSFQNQNELEKAYSLVRIFDSLAHLRVVGGRMDLKIRLKVLDIITSTAVGDLGRAHDTARFLLLEDPKSADMAFAYAVIDQMWTMESDAQRHRSFQFLKRLRGKKPYLHLIFIAGNCSSRGGINIRRYTVGIYLHALKLCPHHPLICLVLAVQTLYVAMGRRIVNRNEMIMYAVAFLDDYIRNRQLKWAPEHRMLYEMEADYNLGRAMHQLGLLHFATEAYRRVLDNKYTSAGTAEIPDWADLRRDAAFNLIQIYRGSGNNAMAVALCQEYLVY